MIIVPESEALAVEVTVPPQDIDHIHGGQPAVLRLAAFNQRTTPELNGEVSVVSADVSLDTRTGGAYYTIRIKVSEEEIARLGGFKLMPGMPIEAFVQTTPRTVLSSGASAHRPDRALVPRKVMPTGGRAPSRRG